VGTEVGHNEGFQWGKAAQWLIGQMAIKRYVDQYHKIREALHHTCLQCTQKTAATLLKMSAKAVKKVYKSRGMKHN
jgi:hypothetical protein